MTSRFQKPLTLILAQAILAISLPLAALAAPSDTLESTGFELPINDVMVVDQAGNASASKVIAMNDATNSDVAILKIDDILPNTELPLSATNRPA